MAGGVCICQAEADVWSQPLPAASIRSLPIVRGTPEGTLCTHDKQTTGSSRMDWRDDHGTEATTIQRSRIEKSWRDPGRYGTPSPPLRSLRQRVDACRTALFPPSRQPISSGLLVVSERLQSSNSVTAEAHADACLGPEEASLVDATQALAPVSSVCALLHHGALRGQPASRLPSHLILPVSSTLPAVSAFASCVEACASLCWCIVAVVPYQQ